MTTPPTAASPTTQPPERPKKPWYKRWWVWVIIVIVTIVLAIALLFVYMDSTEKSIAKQECVERVTAKAKYPGGVDFVQIDDPTYSDFRQGAVYNMFGEVDFPNGFGTPVRHSFTCEIEMSFSDVLSTDVDVYEGSISGLGKMLDK